MTDTQSVPLLHTVSGAVQRLQISRSIIYKEMAAGRLKPVKVGRRTYFTEAELHRYVDTLVGGAA